MKKFVFPFMIIISLLIISGCTKGSYKPKVTDSGDTVLDFNNLEITKGDLYDMMKKNTGLSTLMNKIDRDLLAEYKDKVDTEELEDRIADDKKSQGEDTFYEGMIFQGVISSKEDPEADEKIKDYYLLSFLQKAYAKDIAVDEIENDESTSLVIQEAKDNYHEDLCIITLKYDSKNEADTIKDKLIQENDVLQFFKDEYADQHKDDPTPKGEITVEKIPFITEPFNCEYDRAIYENYTARFDFRDFIFKDSINGDSFGIGDYNKDPKYILSDHTYYFIYKVNKPKYIENFRESEEFTQFIKDDLIQKKLTSTYITEQIIELRQSINLRIFDTEIADQYKESLDKDFKSDEKLLKIRNGGHILASYKIDGTTKYVYADDLYDLMKERYAVQLLLDKINTEALKSIPEIQLSKSERDEIKTQIKNYKTQYLQQLQTYSWAEYITLYFGAFNEEQLIDIVAAPKLIERYLLGYEDFQGVSQVKEEDIEKAYQEWFSIEASHVLFTFELDDTESKELAREKGKQIINGCTDDGKFRDGITEDTCYIYYDPEDPTNEEIPFAGLDEIKVYQYEEVFKEIAIKYSQYPFAYINSGNLGFFGPGQMVPEFENAAKEIASRIKEGDVPFTLLPVESAILRPDGTVTHGFHVIYVTDSKDKVTLDEAEQTTYNQYIADLDDTDVNINEKYSQTEIAKFNKYKSFRDELKSTLEEAQMKKENQNKLLAELRDSKEFSLNDTVIQTIYENINTLQKAYGNEDK